MDSAFGVDHGEIGKSMLPGGAFKPITQMKTKDLKKLKTAKGSQYKASRGPTAGDTAFKQANQEQRKVLNDRNIKLPFVNEYRGLHGGVQGKTLKMGGKKSNESLIDLSVGVGAKKKNVNAIRRHEQAHATPKRSAYRFKQIAENPKKLMREEARADFIGSGHYKKKTNSLYAATANAQRGKDKGLRARGTKRMLTSPDRADIKAQGLKPKNFSARKLYRVNVDAQVAAMPQYKNMDEGVRAYRKVHDKMAAAQKRKKQ